MFTAVLSWALNRMSQECLPSESISTHHVNIAAPDINVRNNMLEFAFNPLNYANNQISFASGVKQMALVILGVKSFLETGRKNSRNKAEKTQIAIVTITIIAASINMKYGPVWWNFLFWLAWVWELRVGWSAKNSIRHNYIAIRYKCNWFESWHEI